MTSPPKTAGGQVASDPPTSGSNEAEEEDSGAAAAPAEASAEARQTSASSACERDASSGSAEQARGVGELVGNCSRRQACRRRSGGIQQVRSQSKHFVHIPKLGRRAETLASDVPLLYASNSCSVC